MVTRHFHATLLVIVSIAILFALSYFLGKTPHLPQVNTGQQQIPAATIAPSQTPQQQFLYYDQTPTYNSFFAVDPDTGVKSGLYGSVSNLEPYTSFFLFNNQLYMQRNTNAGILSLSSHFFYPVSQTSIPITTSPDQTKALFLDTSINPKTKLKTQEFRLISSDKQITFIPIIQILPYVFQPVCWVNNNQDVIFRSANQLYTLNTSKKTLIPSILPTQISQSSNIFCNSNTNTLFFQTKTGIYEQKFNGNKLTQLQLPLALAKNLTNLVFPQDTVDNEALSATTSSIVKLNLKSGAIQTVYTASQSAQVQPYLWDENANTIVFTQTEENKDGTYTIVGKTLNTQNQIINIFASYQANTLQTLGAIVPISWLKNIQ